MLTIFFYIFLVASSPNMSIEDKMEVDGRSVFVGNVRRCFTFLKVNKHIFFCKLAG